MKNKSLIVLLTLALLTIVVATGCSSSYVTREQFMALQNQVNSLSNSLNSAQQQLSSAQQSLSQAQSQLQRQNTYGTYAQPAYQPNTIYQTYPYGYRTYPYGYQTYPYGY